MDVFSTYLSDCLRYLSLIHSNSLLHGVTVSTDLKIDTSFNYVSFYPAVQISNLGPNTLGLAQLIEISVNWSIYKRKTIIDMKVTFNGCSVYLFN